MLLAYSTHPRPRQPKTDDDKFTPTKHLTPPPNHSSSRPAAAHTETETPLLHQKKGVGPVDGPPQPICDLKSIWPIVGPPKLAPEGGPGPGGQSKGTWTLVLARPHGVETKFQKSAQITNHRARCGVAARRSPTVSRHKGGPEPTQVETTVVVETTNKGAHTRLNPLHKGPLH